MNIVVASPSFSKNEVLKKEIAKCFPNVKLNLGGARFDKDGFVDFVKDADGIVVGLETVDTDVLSKLPKLKIISKYGVGLNNINLDECKKRNIAIGWTGGVNRLSVAEMALGYMLMFCRNLYITSNQLKSGKWNKDGGFQLSGKTVGIIGVGHIGKELVRLLQPFACRVLVNDIIDQTEYYKANNLEEVTKDYLFANSDIVTIHTPLDESTANLIDSKVLNSMKPTAYLLNSARGGIINEHDLKIALMSSTIAGAAMDAYTEEPPNDTEMLSLPNLICTPHIGGNANEAVEAMGMSAIYHLKEYFKV